MRNLLFSLFTHRFLAIARWDFHFIGVRIRNRVIGQRRRVRRFLSTRKQPAFLNLGSGPRGRADDHWVNVDGFRDLNVHFVIDFGRPLPFPDDSFDGVFCEHVVEHFSREDGQRLAREVHRVLKPGGCLRVIVPDAEILLRLYFEAPQTLVDWRGDLDQTPMETVNSYFRQRYEHQFLYDWPTLNKMLAAAGFDQVLRTAFGAAQSCEALTLDDPKYARESLYVEAVKR